MNEWPTRVRTARAPVSAMTSGTCAEQMTLWTIGDVRGIRPVGDRAGDLAAGDEGGDGARAHRLAALVDDEAPVGVAVEGEAEVGAVLADRGLEVDEVLRVEGVGLVVGEGAVELEVQGDDGERQRVEPGTGAQDGRHGVAAHAVAGVDDDGEGRMPDRSTRPRGRRRSRPRTSRSVGARAAARWAGGGGGDVAGEDPLGEVADLGEAGVLADGAGAGAAELDAVVLGGVVARGEHGAGQVEGAAGVVEAVGAGQADERDVDASAADAVGEGRGQARGSSRACRGR